MFECSKCHEISPEFSMKCNKCEQMFTMSEMSSYRRISGVEKPMPLSEVKMSTHTRIPGLPEIDRILGGGIVAGSAVLIGGEPGIGKSTLILQMCGQLEVNVLYVSAEESVYQSKLRAERLGISNELIKIVSEPNVSVLCKFIKELDIKVVVIDSIQAVYTDNVASSPGSPNQVKESASELVDFCRHSNVALILVGHITKDDNLAGPKSLQHLVDTVLYFEGDMMQYRVLRCVKNRFGATDETAIFKMTKCGLKEIEDSAEFISATPSNEIGTAICPAIIGSRLFMVEIQSLISKTAGNPVRRINGLDTNRVNMIIAVMERVMGLSLYSFDVYINVVAGIHIEEPAADLSVAMSLLSSLKNKALPAQSAYAGEIGLTGEIRPVPNIELRIKEAEKLKFGHIVVPANNKVDERDGIIVLSRLVEVLEMVV